MSRAWIGAAALGAVGVLLFLCRGPARVVTTSEADVWLAEMAIGNPVQFGERDGLVFQALGPLLPGALASLRDDCLEITEQREQQVAGLAEAGDGLATALTMAELQLEQAKLLAAAELLTEGSYFTLPVDAVDKLPRPPQNYLWLLLNNMAEVGDRAVSVILPISLARFEAVQFASDAALACEAHLALEEADGFNALPAAERGRRLTADRAARTALQQLGSKRPAELGLEPTEYSARLRKLQSELLSSRLEVDEVDRVRARPALLARLEPGR
ncbi:MAG: hypothetical protein AAF628_13670 [Planctomycetota bacterium]